MVTKKIDQANEKYLRLSNFLQFICRKLATEIVPLQLFRPQ
jgi:hypothetical protein